ncbi:hypothetical protein HK405_001953, partial [Cladochytrium tenue]
ILGWLTSASIAAAACVRVAERANLGLSAADSVLLLTLACLNPNVRYAPAAADPTSSSGPTAVGFFTWCLLTGASGAALLFASRPEYEFEIWHAALAVGLGYLVLAAAPETAGKRQWKRLEAGLGLSLFGPQDPARSVPLEAAGWGK